MSACEKCWADAYRMVGNGFESQTEAYEHLLKEREGNPCSLKEQIVTYSPDLLTTIRGKVGE